MASIKHTDLAVPISRLAQFSPSSPDEYGHQILDYIVLDCCGDFDLNLVSPKELKIAIKQNLKVDFEQDEIISSARRLSIKGLMTLIEPTKRTENPKFQLKEDALSKIQANRSTLGAIEKKVLKDWKEEILLRYEGAKEIEENLHQITSILQKFIAKMFVQHGVETVSLLYPGENTVKKWLKLESDSLISKFFKPTGSFFDNVIKIEIPRFFTSPDTDRKRYLSNLFNSSFFWHLIQVDESCSKLLGSVTRGQKLILDNNILYSLCGINGDDSLESSHSMLKFAKELGYSLLVTTKTIDEFQNSLRWRFNEFKDEIPLSKDLASVALNELGSDNFITKYWSEFVDKGLSLPEFISDVSHIEDLLDGLGVDTYNKYRKDIDKSDELRDEISILRGICRENINVKILEHDAFHRILITKLRKGQKYNFNSAKAWFLTHDHKLPEYSKVARKGQACMPFCITTNEWIQINRPLLTRTLDQDEFEDSFHTLVTQPYVRSMLPTLPLEQTFNKVLGAIDRFKGMTGDLAAKIVSDRHFMISLLGIDDDKIISEKVENRLLDLNKELRQKNELLILERKSAELKAGKLESKVETISENYSIYQEEKGSQIDKLMSQLSNVLDENRMSEKKNRDEILRHKEENLNLKEKIKSQELASAIRMWKIPGYFAILGVVIILLLLFLCFFFQANSWNFVAIFLKNCESLSELQTEIIKWILLFPLGILQFLVVKFVYSRLWSKKALTEFKKDFISD